MLTKYEFDKLAEEISDEYINNDRPLNDSIKVVAIKMELNPEQIKRLTESSNIRTYNKIYDKLDDKTFKFDLGDSKKVIDDIYSDDKEEIKIKDMAPVEYKPEKNPKAPEENYEILGDNNELEVSKNTMNSEDAAGDGFLDALKVPKKDYSYSDESSVSESDEEDSDEDNIEEETEEEELQRKTAMINEFKPEIRKELEHREMLCADALVTNTQKFASQFKGVMGKEKFITFVKNACVVHASNPHLSDAVKLVATDAHIDLSAVHAAPLKYKIASEKKAGDKEFNSILDGLEELRKLNNTHKFLNN